MLLACDELASCLHADGDAVRTARKSVNALCGPRMRFPPLLADMIPATMVYLVLYGVEENVRKEEGGGNKTLDGELLGSTIHREAANHFTRARNAST